MSFEEQDQEHYATMSTLYNWRLGKINMDKKLKCGCERKGKQIRSCKDHKDADSDSRNKFYELLIG